MTPEEVRQLKTRDVVMAATTPTRYVVGVVVAVVVNGSLVYVRTNSGSFWRSAHGLRLPTAQELMLLGEGDLP